MKDNDKRLWVQTLWNPINDKHQSPLESKEPGIKVAAYCRVSISEEEQLKSLENQVHHYTHYIKSKPNWRFVGIYYDKGVSGASTSKRRGFQRLLRHAEEGKVDLILTKNISRFSRNSKELIDIVNHLKELEVGIYFEKEKIDTSTDYNKFLLSTYAALAQEEIESLSNSTMWGYEKKFMQGKPKFSRLLGYRLVGLGDDQRIEVIEEEAETVRKIYSKYLEGLTYADIARYLSTGGIKTVEGKPLWSGRVIKTVLTNVTYTGNKLSREMQRDLFTRKINYGKRDQVFIENTHEPIISIEVFNQVQKKVEETTQKRGPIKPKAYNPLAQRLICGKCGYMLSCAYKKDNQNYRCRSRVMKICDSITYSKPMIRDMMLKAMKFKYDFSNDEIIAELLKEIQIINQNDHFEFHRLKYITEIEIVKRKLALGELADTSINVERMEKEYREFEAKIAKIEDDREIRLNAVAWLKEHKTRDDFVSGVTSEIMRAWISELTIYTPDDFIVHWIDGSQSKIGDCDGHEEVKQRNEKIRDEKLEIVHANSNAEKIERKETEELHLLKREKGQADKIFKREEDADLSINTNADIIKIEPGQKDYVMKSLNKSLNANYLLRDPTINHSIKDKPKLRTAAYCRISTDSEEQMVSLKTQVAYYTYLILKDPQYEYAGIYADEGISGKSLKNRNEFLKLMDECKAGNVDLILTKSISRFSRNSLDCLEMVRMLKNLPKPVYVLFEKEGIFTKDEKSDLMISIFGSIAQEESINTGEAMAWGKRRYAERGIVRPSNLPYGYRNGANGKWEVVEEEAAVIRKIFRDTINGRTYNEIAKDLNFNGVKTSKGTGQWWISTVKNVLTNEPYRGNYLYQKTYTKDTLTDKRVKNDGFLPQFLIENHHIPIIDNYVWERAQEIVNDRAEKFANRNKVKYPKDERKNKAFDGMISCGICKSPVSHRRYIQCSVEIHEWLCNKASKAIRTDQCDSLRLNQKYLELHFMKTLLNIRERKSAFKAKVVRHINSVKLTPEEEVDKGDVLKRIEHLNQKLYRAVDQELNKKGQDSRKVDELTEQIVILQNKLKEYTDREARVIELGQELAWFMEAIIDIDEEQVNNIDALDPDVEIYFSEAIYTRSIKEATVHQGGKIVYRLELGIDWTIDYLYEEFQEMFFKRKEDLRIAKKLDFLNGPDVQAMVDYCIEPKKYGELHAFMNERKSISYSYFRKSIIRPLLKMGRIKYTIPEDPGNRHQKYIAVLD